MCYVMRNCKKHEFIIFITAFFSSSVLFLLLNNIYFPIIYWITFTSPVVKFLVELPDEPFTLHLYTLL